ncbi:MAG: hypothetical protein KF866_08740 [Phycisphaeraceae bacterium]|nr:hypothetical protein [Phycisphaeraceae bacterium]MCW5753964.1 hypothetical protein [Phycisphaeraceae bacterium]
MNATDRDVLISRIIDGEASAEDWSLVRAMAERDPTLWSELAAAQQDHTELCAAVAMRVDIAEQIEAPIEEVASQTLRRRLRLAGSGGGWLIAAALALAWVLGPHTGRPAPVSHGAALFPHIGTTPEEALEAYIQRGAQSGRVVGVVPELLVQDSWALEDGSGYEIYYIRQIVERVVVPDLYRLTQTESGELVPTKAPLPSQRSGRM